MCYRGLPAGAEHLPTLSQSRYMPPTRPPLRRGLLISAFMSTLPLLILQGLRRQRLQRRQICCLRQHQRCERPGSARVYWRWLPYPSCNGLQWKWLRTAINENLRPDYLHLSIPSGRDYLQLRLLLSSWDCNRRRWDHITCDSPEPPSSACLDARGSICLSRERLEGAPVSYISRPGTESVSSHLKAPY
jgi:hypothetical protein